jgi:hypothetical protein
VVNQQLVASRTVPFPCDLIRSLFPALNQERDSSFLITRGAQIPQVVFDAINGHLLHGRGDPWRHGR